MGLMHANTAAYMINYKGMLYKCTFPMTNDL